MRYIQIGKEVIALFFEEKEGKIVLGKLEAMPVGLFGKRYQKILK